MSPHKLLSSLPTIYRAASNFVGRGNCLRVDIPRDRMWSRRIDCQSFIKDRFFVIARWEICDLSVALPWETELRFAGNHLIHWFITRKYCMMNCNWIQAVTSFQSLIFVTLVIRLLVVKAGRSHIGIGQIDLLPGSLGPRWRSQKSSLCQHLFSSRSNSDWKLISKLAINRICAQTNPPRSRRSYPKVYWFNYMKIVGCESDEQR